MSDLTEFERRYRALSDEMAAARAMPLGTDEERFARFTRRVEVNVAMAELIEARAEFVDPGSLLSWSLMMAADLHRERAESAQERADSARARLDQAGAR